MAANHSISDLVSTLKNGQLARRDSVLSDVSAIREQILGILKEEGYIEGYSEVSQDSGVKKIKIDLKYHLSEPVIKDIKVISKPGKRVYCGVGEIPLAYDGLGVVILSTPKGVLPDYKAKELKVGGELLLKIF